MGKNDIQEIEITTEYIKLDQLLKWANVVDSGAYAKMVILDGQVKYNGIVEIRRGKKIYPGDMVEFNGEKIQIALKK